MSKERPGPTSCKWSSTGFALGFALTAAVAFAQAPQPPAPLPTPLPLFPPDNWWNVDVSGAPLDPNSSNFIGFIDNGKVVPVHPDFGGSDGTTNGIYGMPYVVVPHTQPLEPVTFVEFGSESDAGAPGQPPGYPIPVGARTEPKWIESGNPGGCSGGDDHMLLVDGGNRILFELYHTCWNVGMSRWEAGSGAVFELDGNGRRPDGWTSADAAGLAILPGLVRYDEVFGSNPIKHAFRFTVRSSNGYVFPASHNAGSTSGALPMGARLRLKASKDISAFSAPLQKIAQALKTYGLIVADNGTDMYVTGTYDPRWETAPGGVVGPSWPLSADDFEVVALGWQPAAVPPPAPSFYTLTPCRLLDTRLAANQLPPGPYGGPALPPLPGERALVVTGRCSIPTDAKALAVNVTVVNAPAIGDLRLFPSDSPPPATSVINFMPGRTRANNAVVMLASSGSGAFSVRNDTPGLSVDVVVDVNGYFK
jgi:hypothetical protein